MSTAVVELVAPAVLGTGPISETATVRINNFMNEINQLNLAMQDDVMSEALLNLQQHIDEYTTKVELASKVASAVIKAITSLDNMQ